MKKGSRSILQLFSANTVTKLLGLILLAVYTSFLTKSELSILPIMTVLGRASVVIFSFGILPTLVRDIPGMPIKLAKSYINTALLIILPGIIVFSLSCYLFSSEIAVFVFKESNISEYIKWLSIGILFAGLNQAFDFILWALARFKEKSQTLVFSGIVRFLLGVSLVVPFGVKGLIITLVVSSFLNSLISLYFLRDIITARLGLYPVNKIMKQSWPFYLESYLMYFRAEGDQLLVASVMGAESLGVYYVARRLYFVLNGVTKPIDTVITSTFASLKKKYR